jgi:signal transduction histidine kinase
MELVGFDRSEQARRARRRPAIPAIAKFAVSGLLVVVLLGFAGVELLQRIGRREAIRDAKNVAALAGRGIVQPYVTRGALDGDVAQPTGKAEQLASLDRAVRDHVLTGGVVRVKIWSRDGRILYSDERRLVGTRYRLDDEETEAFERSRTDAEVSDLAAPENRYERRYDKLLEVYLPIRDRDGRPLLFETYSRYSTIAASGRHLWSAFAPALIGALILLWLVQMPLAWNLARRLRRGQEEREQLLQRAIDASAVERRRIARDLHDGAVQSLAGVSYGLTAAVDRSAEERAAAMRDAAAATRRTIRELRTLLVDIYPPDLHRTGIGQALRDLVAPLAPRGIATTVEIDDDDALPPEIEALLFRCAQEVLRNVVAHADARHVDVRLELNGNVALTIADDGRGFEPGTSHEGHFGLQLLRDLARETGASVSVDSAPARGTTVRVEAPLP